MGICDGDVVAYQLGCPSRVVPSALYVDSR